MKRKSHQPPEPYVPALRLVALPDGTTTCYHHGEEVSMAECRRILMADDYAVQCWAGMLNQAEEMLARNKAADQPAATLAA